MLNMLEKQQNNKELKLMLKFTITKCQHLPICLKTPKLLHAAVFFRKTDRPYALLSITKFQNQLTFLLRNQVKLPLYLRSISKLEIISMQVCLKNHWSHITQTHSEADFHKQLLWCHTKTHLRLLLETDQLTTRGNSFQLIWTLTLSQNNSKQETQVSSLTRPLDKNTCKNSEIWYVFSEKLKNF